MIINMNKVVISALTLGAYIEALKGLNPEYDCLFVQTLPEGLEGMEFVYEGRIFTITGADLENYEEPLLSAMLKGYEVYENDIDNGEVENGYYSVDRSSSSYFSTEFVSHTKWQFSAGERYARNVPGLEDDALIGFYWIPLSGIMENLYSPVDFEQENHTFTMLKDGKAQEIIHVITEDAVN